jgi:large subunit ribosomal protein L3
MHRRIGSAGASAYPSKIIKGLGMPGHMGDCFRTTKNLKVLKVDTDKNILFVSGNIPGSRGSIVQIRKTK